MEKSVGYAEGMSPLGTFSFHWAHVSMAVGLPKDDRKKLVVFLVQNSENISGLNPFLRGKGRNNLSFFLFYSFIPTAWCHPTPLPSPNLGENKLLLNSSFFFLYLFYFPFRHVITSSGRKVGGKAFNRNLAHYFRWYFLHLKSTSS